MNFLAEEYMASWAKRGYFVIRGFAKPDEIRELRRSCDIVLDQIRPNPMISATQTQTLPISQSRDISGATGKRLTGCLSSWVQYECEI